MANKLPHKKSVCFIINPISGNKRRDNISSLIESEIDHEKYAIELKFTNAIGHGRELANQAIKDKHDIIIAVGGDGTINEVAGELINKEVLFGIIPRGSGNGLARHLRLHLNAKKAVQTINNLKTTKIDTAEINGKTFISIAGIGFDALVAKYFAKSKDRGYFSYFRIVTSKFFKYTPKIYELAFADRTVIETRALLIAFANSNQFGYNTQIAPKARINDGKLDVCIVSKPKLYHLPVMATLLLLKRIDLSHLVRIIQTEKVIVKRKKNKMVNIDGEPVKLQKQIIVKVNPLSLNVIIP